MRLPSLPARTEPAGYSAPRRPTVIYLVTTVCLMVALMGVLEAATEKDLPQGLWDVAGDICIAIAGAVGFLCRDKVSRPGDPEPSDPDDADGD